MSGGMGDRFYMMALIKWAAQKVGPLKDGKHRWLYDGCEWDELDPAKTDSLGLPTEEGMSDFSARELAMFDKINGMKKGSTLKMVRAEMQRLDALWED